MWSDMAAEPFTSTVSLHASSRELMTTNHSATFHRHSSLKQHQPGGVPSIPFLGYKFK